MNKDRPVQPHRHPRLRSLPAREVRSQLDSTIREHQDDNAGIDSARLAGQTAEKAGEALRHRQQKQAIKKQYAAAKRGTSASQTAKDTASGVRQTVKTASEKVQKAGQYLWRHRKGAAVLLLAAVLFLFMLNAVSSCGILMQGVGSAVAGSTYPSTDEAMIGAEAAYAEKEALLQGKLDHYETEHNFDEVLIEMDEIWHDPYVLISLLTAYHQGEWTLEEVQPTLQMLFDRQYILTESVETETRYRTEIRTGYREVSDPDTGETRQEEYEYEVQVPYSYVICTVSMENFNLSHLPIYIMGERQLSMYAMYMSTLGNRPDLFPQSQYPHASVYQEPLRYEVPEALLSDEQFSKMLTEAEKYLGYPYIWGGYCPATSFDCSGFISWVINHSGWNYGRLGVDGLLAQCRMVSASDARPGDLVFFQGTLDEPGATHVGLYVGNSMMIHCGSPISYADLNTPYWQGHFYGFGRLSGIPDKAD